MNLNKIGKLGEDIVVRFLKRKGFKVINRNYLIKQGELDIVAIKTGIYHFIEVKAVSREIADNRPIKGNLLEPEENMHRNKVIRLINTIEVFSRLNGVSHEKTCFDMCAVYIDINNKKACIRFWEDLPLSVERF